MISFKSARTLDELRLLLEYCERRHDALRLPYLQTMLLNEVYIQPPRLLASAKNKCEQLANVYKICEHLGMRDANVQLPEHSHLVSDTLFFKRASKGDNEIELCSPNKAKLMIAKLKADLDIPYTRLLSLTLPATAQKYAADFRHHATIKSIPDHAVEKMWPWTGRAIGLVVLGEPEYWLAIELPFKPSNDYAAYLSFNGTLLVRFADLWFQLYSWRAGRLSGGLTVDLPQLYYRSDASLAHGVI